MEEKYFTHLNYPNCGASMTLSIGNFLLDKEYIEKKKVKNIIPDGNTVYKYTLRVASLDKEQENKNSL